MPNLSLAFLDDIQADIARFNTLGTCLEMAGASHYLNDVNELRGLMLDIAHFQQLQIEHIQGKLDQHFPKSRPAFAHSREAKNDHA